MLLDFTLDVVSAFLYSNSILCLYSIGFIYEVASTAQTVAKRSPETIIEFILMRSVGYSAPVFESDYFAALDIEVDGIHVNTCSETGESRPAVEIIGTFLQEVRDRWMMAYLLQEYFRSISEATLHGFSKDRVKRLIEDVTWLQEGKGGDKDELHPLDGICSKSSSGHVDRTVNSHRSNQVKDRLVAHTADWERD